MNFTDTLATNRAEASAHVAKQLDLLTTSIGTQELAIADSEGISELSWRAKQLSDSCKIHSFYLRAASILEEMDTLNTILPNLLFGPSSHDGFTTERTSIIGILTRNL